MVVSAWPPFPLYTDNLGAPLNNGYVYFGVANQDPVTNPVSVFFDAALTIPAAQPLRTLGGYIVSNGAAKNVYCATDFSTTIKNSQGVTLRTLASYGFRVLSDSITFNTLTVNTSIIPDAAGGATDGTISRAWSNSVTRAQQARKVTVYDTTQPVAGGLNVINQLGMTLAVCSQNDNAGITLVNGKNVASIVTGGTGVYNVTFTVAVPSTSFPFATGRSQSTFRHCQATITGGGATCQVNLMDAAGASQDGSFNLIVIGNPGISDPIL